MTLHNNIDYTDRCFEYPTLSKVARHPDYEMLKKINDKFKEISPMVFTALGGGAHSHLDLVLFPVGYVFVSIAPYIKQVHPGTLVIPTETSNYQYYLEIAAQRI